MKAREITITSYLTFKMELNEVWLKLLLLPVNKLPKTPSQKEKDLLRVINNKCTWKTHIALVSWTLTLSNLLNIKLAEGFGAESNDACNRTL